MNFHWPSFFKREAPHKEVRYVAATKAESEAARQRRADIRCELAVYRATTTPAQRLAETEAFFARAARMRGMGGGR